MRRAITVVGICFFATVCFAQEKYSNSKWHFSFTVPEGWEAITDETVLQNYEDTAEIRVRGPEILALFLQAGPEDKKNTMLVQARGIGEAKEGLTMEAKYEEILKSDMQWQNSNQFLKDFRYDLIEQGKFSEKDKYERRIYYDHDRHFFFEGLALTLKSGEAVCTSTIRLLGNHRLTILSFNLHGSNAESLLNLVDTVVDSFAYDKNYGFGESPPFDYVKVIWHWTFPGIGAVIVIFLVAKWVASEYG